MRDQGRLVEWFDACFYISRILPVPVHGQLSAVRWIIW